METMSDGIWDLADCLNNYQEYLNWKKPDSLKYKISLATTRTLDEDLSVQEPCENLDEAWKSRIKCERCVFGCFLVVVKEGVHISIFENNMQSLRFF